MAGKRHSQERALQFSRSRPQKSQPTQVIRRILRIELLEYRRLLSLTHPSLDDANVSPTETSAMAASGETHYCGDGHDHGCTCDLCCGVDTAVQSEQQPGSDHDQDCNCDLCTGAGLFAQHNHDHGDASLRVDALGYEFYADPIPDIELSQSEGEISDDGSSEVPPFPIDQTFKLHSNPGATKTIYLDFDGHITENTLWNNGGPDRIVTPVYSFQGGASFSTAEHERIQRVWEQVSEDFLPFNVNVTTEDPGVEALRNTGFGDQEWGIRVVIGENTWYSPAGGVAYLHSFNWESDTPTFVFNSGEKGIVEAVSHEVGHTLGLRHDGRTSPSEQYYEGHGNGVTSWGPIMGASYSPRVVTWSKGEYTNANNQEDDLNIIVNTDNGFGYRSDDHGSDSASATELDVAFDLTIFNEGLIERNTDVDYFSITIGDGMLDLEIEPFYRSPNLDILAKLYDISGTELASSNPANQLDAALSLSLTAGTYFVSVEGTGRVADGPGGPDYGYTEYASLGYYSITGSVDALGPPVVTVDTIATNDSTPALTGTINDSTATISVSVAGQSDLVANNNGDGTWTLPDDVLLELVDGTYDVSVIATSTILLTGIDETTDELTIDTVGPVVTVDALSTLDVTPELTGTIDDPNLAVMIDVGIQAGLPAINNGDGTWTLPDNTLAPLGDGTFDIVVTAMDPAGNVGTDSTTDELNVGPEGQVLVFSNSSPISIPQPQGIGTNANYPAEIIVDGVEGEVVDVNVTLEGLTHTYPDDIDILLVSPSGQTVLLMSDKGSGHDVDNITLTFDDSLQAPVPSGQITSGSYIPSNEGVGDVFPVPAPAAPYGNSMAALNGLDPNGVWQLFVHDDAPATDFGDISGGWSIRFVAAIEDDHGNEHSDATPLVMHSSMAGDIEILGDEDYFSFDAIGNHTYRISTDLETLPDSTLTLYGSDGLAELAYNDDGGPGLESELVWTALEDGSYYLKVKAYQDDSIGTYQLLVEDITLPGDFDASGTVDGFDFLTLQRGASNPSPTFAHGDNNSDGTVNAVDVTDWQGGYGQGQTSASAAAVAASSSLPAAESSGPEDYRELAIVTTSADESPLEANSVLPVDLALETVFSPRFERARLVGSPSVISESEESLAGGEESKYETEWLSEEILERVFS